MVSARWCRLSTTRVTPASRSQRRMRDDQRRRRPPAAPPWRGRARAAAGGWPGRRSAPAPASARERAAHSLGAAGEHHVVSRQAVRVAMLQEEEAVRVGDVVGRRAAERARRRRESRPRRPRSRRTCRPAFRRPRSRRRRPRTPRGTSRSGTRVQAELLEDRSAAPRRRRRRSRIPRGSSSGRACAGPLKVSRLLPPSERTRSVDRWRRSRSSSVSNRQSSCRRRPSRGVAPSARIFARASSALSKRSLISRSSGMRACQNPCLICV